MLLVLDEERRVVARLRRSAGGLLLQPSTLTLEDRYPQLFDEVATRLKGCSAPRILSFGCASGEEVRALRARMPGASILGMDINPLVLGRARKADTSPLSEYRIASAPGEGERFDAIFAMAVLRHSDLECHKPESCAAILPFSRFEEAVCRLDAALEPGGLLAIGNAQFRLSDTRLADCYAVELRLQRAPPPPKLLYGPDDRRIDGVREDAVLFRKL